MNYQDFAQFCYANKLSFNSDFQGDYILATVRGTLDTVKHIHSTLALLPTEDTPFEGDRKDYTYIFEYRGE